MSRVLMTTFATIFLAELLDKTQLMVLALGARSESAAERLGIFLAGSAALALSTGLAVYLSGFLARAQAHQRPLGIGAGVVITLIGVAMTIGAVRGPAAS